MNSAILYIRVSTDEQADKGYSQRNQDEVLRRYCSLKEITVQETVYEDHSAKTFNRPAWNKMLNELKKRRSNKSINLILFTKWDRFSRNTADAYQMIGTLRGLGIEPQAIEQPLDLTVPENKMMLAFYLAVPEVENDRRALNIFHGMRRAKKEGRHIATAPTGYINRTTEEGRKYIRPHEPAASIMKFAFNAIAAGDYATDQVWKLAKQQGLRCGRKNFYNLVRNPIYCGKIIVEAYRDEDLQIVDGQHEPLITEALFDQVQKILAGRRPKRGTNQKVAGIMPLRGSLTCPACGRKLSGSASTGRNTRYYYYHCTKGCPVRFKTDLINRSFGQELKGIIPQKVLNDLFKEAVRDVFKSQTVGFYQKRSSLITQLESAKSKLEKARDLYLNDGLDKNDYQSIKIDGEQKIITLTEKLSQLPDVESEVTALLNCRQQFRIDFPQLYQDAAIEDKRRLISALFAEPIIFLNDRFDTLDLQVLLSKTLKINR